MDIINDINEKKPPPLYSPGDLSTPQKLKSINDFNPSISYVYMPLQEKSKQRFQLLTLILLIL